MKKILFVVNDLDIGGLQRVTATVADALNELDDFQSSIFIDQKKIRVFYPTKSTLFFRTKKGSLVYRARNKFFRLLKKIISIIYGNQAIVPGVDKIIAESLVDFLHKNNFQYVILTAGFTMYAGAIKRVFPDLKIIAWQHNNFDTYMNNYFKSTRPDFVKGLQLSDILVALTDSDAHKFSKFNPNSVTIANPITLVNSDNMISNLQGHVISWVGRSSDWRHKGTDYLLKVAANLPDDWVISVAGDKDPLTMNGVLAKADIERARDKIVYAGSLKDQELIQHYANSSIFLMTSRWEGFALVVTEAMSFGLPVVLFDQTGAQAVTNHGEFGKLISTGHIDEMNQYLTLLTRDIALRQQWQKKSLIRSKEYTLNNIIHRWTEILK